MPLMDEFKEERAAIKNASFKKKFAYFWEYYKWYVIIGLAAIITLTVTIKQMLDRKETAFLSILMNGSPMVYNQNDTDHIKNFAAYADIDLEEFNIVYDTTIQIGTGSSEETSSIQKLAVYMAAAEIDTIVGNADAMYNYAYHDSFQDLREFLTPELVEKYADRFFYIDGKVVKEIEEASLNYDFEFKPLYADPYKPEEMEEPIPVGLFLPDDSSLYKDYYFLGKDIFVGVLTNTKHPDTALQYIEYLLNAK